MIKKNIKFIPFLAVISLTILGAGFSLAGNGRHGIIVENTNEKVLEPPVNAGTHDPISIDGNVAIEPFSSSGAGTYESPYVIEDLIINASLAHGIYITNTDAYLIIRNCLVTGDSNFTGIYLNNTMNVNLSKNELTENLYGIRLNASSNNILIGNNANYNKFGIEINWFSNNNTLVGNNVNSNIRDGIVLGSSSNNTLFGNNVNSNIGDGIVLVSSSNNTLSGNNAHDNGWSGIVLFHSSNFNTVTKNNANYNGFGIRINWFSNNNILVDNTACYNNYSIYLVFTSNNNTVTRNNASFSVYNGIHLAGSRYTTLVDNTVSYNTLCGIYLAGSRYNTLAGNTVSYNTLCGIYLRMSTNNTIFGNDIFANLETQACENDSSSIGNKWDNGTAGNFWGDDYNRNYPEATNDGTVWNTPYEIEGPGDGVDHFPLVNPITEMPPDSYKIPGFPFFSIIAIITFTISSILYSMKKRK